MTFIAVVREIVDSGQITQKQIANKAHYQESTMSLKLANKRTLSHADKGEIILATNSPRLSEERCTECPGNLFPSRYLDNVDDHPVVAVDKLIEEVAECIRAAQMVKKIMINKKKGHQFNDQDLQVLTSFEDQTADLITGSKTVLIKLQEWYGRPVYETMQRHLSKLEAKGHCTKRKSPVTRTGLK